jgi:hypothetical protein
MRVLRRPSNFAALLLVLDIVVPGRSFAQASGETCRAPDSRLAVDHVVLAVSDLEESAADFRSLGFTIKPGRLHPNGLFNAHVKFADGTSLEIMSLAGEPTDPVAAAYADFLQSGDGGAFVAIEADPNSVTGAARQLGLPSQLTRAGPFTWVTVDDSRHSPDGQLSPVFFISYHDRPADADSLLAHHAGVSGISSVRLDATVALADLLERLGASPCPPEPEVGADSSVVVGLANAELVLLTKGAKRHPRNAVREVTLVGEPGPRVNPHLCLDERRIRGIRLRRECPE